MTVNLRLLFLSAGIGMGWMTSGGDDGNGESKQNGFVPFPDWGLCVIAPVTTFHRDALPSTSHQRFTRDQKLLGLHHQALGYLHAKQALYQLSQIPCKSICSFFFFFFNLWRGHIFSVENMIIVTTDHQTERSLFWRLANRIWRHFGKVLL